MMLSQIHKRLNDQLIAQKRKPILDEDPKGVTKSDIQELHDVEVPELDMSMSRPAIPPPPLLPSRVEPAAMSTLASITTVVDVAREEEIPVTPPAAVEVESVKAKVQAKKKPVAKKKEVKKKPVTEKKTKEKKVSSRTDPKKITTKVIAVDISIATHEKMEALVKAHPDKFKSKRAVLQYFIFEGLKKASF